MDDQFTPDCTCRETPKQMIQMKCSFPPAFIYSETSRMEFFLNVASLLKRYISHAICTLGNGQQWLKFPALLTCFNTVGKPVYMTHEEHVFSNREIIHLGFDKLEVRSSSVFAGVSVIWPWEQSLKF